ncbi:MAG: hypothetical protein KAV25_01990 [Methanophagales archaeon]|nr:hypothetical protein [Methanophagales archaeon]
MEKYTKVAVVIVLCVLAASAGFLVSTLPYLAGPTDYSQQKGYPIPPGEGGGFALPPEPPMPMPTPVPRAVPESLMPKYGKKNGVSWNIRITIYRCGYREKDNPACFIAHRSKRLPVEF